MARPNLHLRELGSAPFHECHVAPEFLHFVSKKLLPVLDITGYKVHAKQMLAVQMINNLVLTSKRDKCVADSRGTQDSGTRMRAELWDLIVTAGLATKALGSESSGKVTRYRASGRLVKLFEDWPLKHLQDDNFARNTELDEPTDHALVVLRRGRKGPDGKSVPKHEQQKVLPLPKLPSGLKRYIRDMEDKVEKINHRNLKHKWTFDFEPSVALRQMHSGIFGRGGRLYTRGHLSAQSLSKKDRARVLIDDEPVAELDFSGYATRCLYHIHDLGNPPKSGDRLACPEGDVYKPEAVWTRSYRLINSTAHSLAILRGFTKRATNICWNVRSRVAAIRAIEKLLAKHPERDFLSDSIYRVERTTPEGILRRIEKAHAVIGYQFFTQVGMGLQSIDGAIMLDILTAMAQADKPALGIHDSLLCRVSDVAFARKAMIRAYRFFFEFKPVITRTT